MSSKSGLSIALHGAPIVVVLSPAVLQDEDAQRVMRRHVAVAHGDKDRAPSRPLGPAD